MSDSVKDKKPKTKGPILRVETAGDIPGEKLDIMVSKFAEMNDIVNYRVQIEQNNDLVAGFVIYYHGNRYDYSVKGQLDRINSFMKRTRAVGSGDEEETTVFRESLLKVIFRIHCPSSPRLPTQVLTVLSSGSSVKRISIRESKKASR